MILRKLLFRSEHTSFEVPTCLLHVHERVDPRTIIEAVRKRNGDGGMVQGSLFDLLAENPPLRQAIEFYQHAHGWSNRLVAGDSLLVMNSLLEKECLAGKVQMVYLWPNVVRIEHAFRPTLTLDWSKVQPLTLDAAQTAQVAELAPILEGKPDVTQVSRIELERLARESRTQRIIFETARDVFDQMKRDWPGNKEVLLAQLVRLVEQFIRSDKIAITPPLFYQDELPRLQTWRSARVPPEWKGGMPRLKQQWSLAK